MLNGSRTVARVLAAQARDRTGASMRVRDVSDLVSDFGTLADGTQTVSDVQDLLANWDPRMATLSAQVAGLDPDILTDLAHLTSRYSSAAGAAHKAINDSGWDPVPVGLRPMQHAYDAILGALKQVPGTITKGDYDDLIVRVSEARAAVGQHTDVPTVQPTTQDQGMAWYKALAPYDILAQITGAEAPKIWPFAPPDPPDPLHKLEVLIVLATFGLGGVFAVRLFIAPAIKTVAWLAGTVVSGWVAYSGTKAAGEALGKVTQSTAGKALGL